MRPATKTTAAGLALGILSLGACTEMPQATPSSVISDPPAGAQRAIFPAFPEALFFAAGEVCDAPGQSVVRPTPDEVRCESLPDPESAAAIILQFDGTVEDLPKLVIAFVGRDTAQGYVVTADNYIRVPQRTGDVRQVRFPDRRTASEVSQLLQAAGGRPL